MSNVVATLALAAGTSVSVVLQNARIGLAPRMMLCDMDNATSKEPPTTTAAKNIAAGCKDPSATASVFARAA